MPQQLQLVDRRGGRWARCCGWQAPSLWPRARAEGPAPRRRALRCAVLGGTAGPQATKCTKFNLIGGRAAQQGPCQQMALGPDLSHRKRNSSSGECSEWSRLQRCLTGRGASRSPVLYKAARYVYSGGGGVQPQNSRAVLLYIVQQLYKGRTTRATLNPSR